MFFTKWGHSAPALERSLLNGASREAIVSRKIVYPYGVAVDIPTATVYWVDTYLDYVEKVDYSGMNRKTIKRGHPVRILKFIRSYVSFIVFFQRSIIIFFSFLQSNELPMCKLLFYVEDTCLLVSV